MWGCVLNPVGLSLPRWVFHLIFICSLCNAMCCAIMCEGQYLSSLLSSSLHLTNHIIFIITKPFPSLLLYTFSYQSPFLINSCFEIPNNLRKPCDFSSSLLLPTRSWLPLFKMRPLDHSWFI